METKKKMSKSKTLFVFTLVFVVCCLMATSVWAAKKIDLLSSNAAGYIERMNSQDDHGRSKMGAIFGLAQDEEFNMIRQTTDFNGITHTRYQQTYKNIPVWGMQTIVSRNHNDEVVKINGSVVMDIPKDIMNVPGTLDPESALKHMQKQHKEKDANAVWSFRNEEYGTYIYVDQVNDIANLCYVVSFFADTETGNPSRPIFFIDVRSGKVFDSFNRLTNVAGTGPGGNLKTGLYQYGVNYPGFGVTPNGTICTMITTNVKTVDLNHGTTGTTPYSYTCYNNTHEAINGAYCPMNDAQYFGQVVYDMYLNWYGFAVLPFQLTLRVHYSNNYENAFWDGSTTTYGDGFSTFYPLVSLDIVSHEFAHGFTEIQSGLIYSNQSGGINEAFSDMAGEAAEFYMRGTNDFKVGYDIVKAPTGALRYMYDPPLDGASIDHVSEYSDGMDVHYSSGIYNKAFYLIATSPGWTTRMAFNIFMKANMDYWIPSTTFLQGAEAVIAAAVDYGYDWQDVANAFAQVGAMTAYCASQGYYSNEEWIARVKMGTLDNSSGPSGYTDFTHITSNLVSGKSVKFTLTPGFSGSSYPEYWRIWIDYNNDHDFVDAGELEYSGYGTSAVSGTFTVNSGIHTFTRMRVSMKYAAYPTPCETFTYGEVEDYSVHIGVGAISYCYSRSNIQSFEYIGRVKIGALDKTSGASPYSDYTSIVTNYTRGTAQSVILTPIFPGSTYTEYWRIWIDYNKDGDFVDTGETVFSASGSTVVTGAFTVSPTAATGNTRMRVTMKYASAPTSCETFTYGEVEDYTANIL